MYNLHLLVNSEPFLQCDYSNSIVITCIILMIVVENYDKCCCCFSSECTVWQLHV